MGINASTVHKAAGAGDMEALADALRAQPDSLNLRGSEDYTPLHIAALYGQLDCVVILIAKGAFLDARTHERATPLYLAAAKGHLDVVRVLCDNGADMDLATRRDHTPLMGALSKRQEAVALDLINRGARIDVLTRFGNDARSIAERFDLQLAVKAIEERLQHEPSQTHVPTIPSSVPSRHASVLRPPAAAREVEMTTVRVGKNKSPYEMDERDSDSGASVDSTTGYRKSDSGPISPQDRSAEPFEEDMTSRVGEGDDTLCLMCVSHRADILLLPCRHLCVCGTCYDTITGLHKMHCPICRAEVNECRPVALA